MTNDEIKRLLVLARPASQLLNLAAKQMKMSARGYMRTLKVAQTIADLSNLPEIQTDHITEALAYRKLPEVTQ